MNRIAPAGVGTAAIAGAGIGGLTTALSLGAIGVASTIVERRTILSETGAGIQLSPNASSVLLGLGLGPALMRRAVEPACVRVRALRSGSELAVIPLGESMRERYGAPYLVIARADLHTVLLDAVRGRRDCRILVGRTVTSGRTQGTAAELSIETASGQHETLTADIAIGADGIWSRLRQSLGGSAPIYRGHHAWRAVIPASALPSGLSATDTGLWLGGRRHLVHYAVDGGRSINIVAVIPAAKALPDWGHAAEGGPVTAAFARADKRVRDLISAASEWRVHALHDIEPKGDWNDGRIALLGDAAHPVLPYLAQGGALAIEDAAQLAGLLAEAAKADMAADRALALYAAARRARARMVQSHARRNGRIYHLPAPFSLARNIAMRSMGGEGLAARYDWLYGWRP